MSLTALQYENQIRLGFFLGVFLVVALWEIYSPRRKLNESKLIRWGSNLSIVGINTWILRFFFSTSAVGYAFLINEFPTGIMSHINLPYGISILVSVIILDFAIYAQHVIFHGVPILWRFHRMHHTDLDYDVTTGARFHPVEIVLSMAIKFLMIKTLGCLPMAVIIFEILLNATAMFNHGNIFIPEYIDKYLRWFIVTPDMHRVHHSTREEETNSNFGFNLPWWDKMFGTYLYSPQDGHQDMKIGLETFRDSKYLKLHWLLGIPFMNPKKSEPTREP